jgi:hypothetical protein
MKEQQMLIFKAKPQSFSPLITFEEACEIMPKERVISIHDTVHFLGLSPQTIESAIDPLLSITADELAHVAASGTHVLVPIIGTPHDLASRDPSRLVFEFRRPRGAGRIVPSRLERAHASYRLMQIGPDALTIGKDFSVQKAFLAHTCGQKVAGPHALSLATLMLHELRGIDLVGSQMVRTSETVGTGTCVGLRFESNRVIFDFVPRIATPRIGAIGEIVL